MLPAFPRVPEVENGMVLSAATLNSYHRGLRYLLGQAHEPRLYQTATDVWHEVGIAEGMHTIYSGNAPLIGWTLYYNFWVKDWDWSWQVGVTGDDAAWHTLASGSGSGDAHPVGTVDLSGSAAFLTEGKIYTWAVKLDSTHASYNSSGAVWALTIRPSSVAGWAAPPAIVNAAVSDEADLNGFRTDLYALRDWLTGYNHGLTGTTGSHYVDVSQWHTFWRGTQRWKAGQSVYVSIQAKGYQNNGRKYCDWGVDLVYPTRSGAYWSTLNVYTKSMTQAELNAGGGQYVRFDATIPSATFGALTEGTYYGLVFWVYLGGSAENGNDIWVQRPIAKRVAATAPAAGWPTLTEWAHGQQSAGATRLNAISTALTALNTGGVENLFPEVPATGGTGAMVHAKPWLVYYLAAGAEPVIRFGANNEERYDLPRDVTGQYVSFDLSAVRQLTPGALYILTGVQYAIEADGAYSG